MPIKMGMAIALSSRMSAAYAAIFRTGRAKVPDGQFGLANPRVREAAALQAKKKTGSALHQLLTL